MATHSWLASMACLELEDPGRIMEAHGPAYRCPMCMIQAVDGGTDWVREPVTQTPVCIGCACDAVAYVIAPRTGKDEPPRHFAWLAESAGVENEVARLIWLRHVEDCIKKAMKAGRGLKTSEDDLVMITELIEREMDGVE